MALECKWEHVSPLSQCMLGVGVCLCVVFSVCDGSYMTHLLCNCLILSLKITLHWREWTFYFIFYILYLVKKKKKHFPWCTLASMWTCKLHCFGLLIIIFQTFFFFYNKPLPMALLLQLACCERWSCHACFALSLLRLLLTQEVSSHLKHRCVFFLHAGVNVNEVQVTQQGRLVWGCPVFSWDTHMISLCQGDIWST